jgi:hypothetical protein
MDFASVFLSADSISVKYHFTQTSKRAVGNMELGDGLLRQSNSELIY